MFRRASLWLALALVLAGGLSLALSPALVNGQGTATVSVEATIITPTELSITLCDQTAEFGNDLNYLGTLPVAGSTTDTIFVTAPGDPAQNQGVFYGWTPSCGPGESFMHVDSNVPWKATVCATESTGSSGLRISNGDLRYSPLQATTYAEAQSYAQIKTCDNPTGVVNSGPIGPFNSDYRLYLQVDRTDAPGDFSSTTTWSVTP